jgi:hypothetical protein
MTRSGGWQAERPVMLVSSVEELLKQFPHVAEGLLVWDEQVPATSNVGVTVAGVESLLPVRYDDSETSLFHELMSAKPLPVKRSFVLKDGSPVFTGIGKVPETDRESTGSAKNDAYIWLLENYIKPGKTNPEMLGYFIDAFWLQCWQAAAFHNHMLNNLDFIVANKAVVFDLNVWEDDTCVDDPKQQPGTDLKTLREILMACVEGTQQKKMIAIFGFPPWVFKYTAHSGGKHGDVDTEWKYCELITAYNAYKDADALGWSSFPNGSFYQNYEVPAKVEQDAEPTREKLIEQGVLDKDGKLLSVNYYAHYQGDFDAAAWVYWHFAKIWDDPARGTLPLSWAINPSIAVRFPFGMHEIRKHSQPGEVFIAGEGAGYVNQSLLQAPRPKPHLPDAYDVWVDHNKKWYEQWDLDVTGFNIDGNTPAFNDRAFREYKKFSPGGVGLQFAPSAYGVSNGLPYIRVSTTLPGSEGNADMGQTVDAVHGAFSEDVPSFNFYRSILQSPSYYAEIDRRLQEPGRLPSKLVDAPTLMWLIKEFSTNPEYAAMRKSYAQVNVVRVSPEIRDGMSLRASADGIAQEVEVSGEKGWSSSGAGSQHFIYFGVHETFAGSIGPRGVIVKVTYLDQSAVSVAMQYDSRDETAPVRGAYKDVRPNRVTGSGTWKTAEFMLPDAKFSARQNGSADFRLHAFGKPLIVRSVEVVKN